ncbi:MAG: PDZ domain-containing protein [Fibrella sp.]|nr:PDZ domain-containing protein [Armatimonadota bacterium]
MFGLLLAALLEVEWIGFPFPALAPMGAAILIANGKHAAFTEREKRDLMIGAAFAVACAAFIVWRAQDYAKTEIARMAAEQKKQIGFENIQPVGNSRTYVIMEVLPESRAQKAGLRPGDVVQKINGTPVETLAKDREKYAETLRTASRDGITLTIKSGDQPAARDISFPPVGSGKPDPTPLPSPGG